MIHVLAMISAGEGGVEGLRNYEAQAVQIVQAHGGRLLSAFVPRRNDNLAQPDEIHLLEFPSGICFSICRRMSIKSRQDEREAVLGTDS